MHKNTVVGIRVASEVAYDQMFVSQAKLKKAQLEVEVSKLRAEVVNAELETSQARLWKLETTL